MKHRDIINYNKIKAEIHLDDHALLKIAHNIALMHGIPHSHNSKNHITYVTGDDNNSYLTNDDNQNKNEETSAQPTYFQKNDECLEEKYQGPTNINHDTYTDTDTDTENKNNEKPSQSTLNIIPTPPLLEEHLDDIKTPITLKEIDAKIQAVQDKLLLYPTENIRAPYKSILDTIIIFRDKAEQLEKHQTSTSQKKSKRVKVITYNITNCILTLLTSDYPRLEVMKSISKDLRNNDNDLLDKHRTCYGRFFKFKTDARKKLDNIEKAVTVMVRTEFHS